MELFVILVIAAIVCFAVEAAIDARGKKRYGEEEWNRAVKATKEAAEEDKMMGYRGTRVAIHCPRCKHFPAREIPFSDKIKYPQLMSCKYHCVNCLHAWK